VLCSNTPTPSDCTAVGHSAPSKASALRAEADQKRSAAHCSLRVPASRWPSSTPAGRRRRLLHRSPPQVIVARRARTPAPPHNSGRGSTGPGCARLRDDLVPLRTGLRCTAVRPCLASPRPITTLRPRSRSLRAQPPASLGQPAGGRASPAPHHPAAPSHPLRSPGTGLQWLGLRPHGRGGFASHLSFRPSQTGVKRDSKKKRFFSSRVSHPENTNHVTRTITTCHSYIAHWSETLTANSEHGPPTAQAERVTE